MSEQRMRRALMGAAMTAAMLATPPALAESCAPLSANFVLCSEGTPWAEARHIQFGDGTALEMGPYYLEFVEHWAEHTEDSTVDAALDELLALMQEHDRDEGMDPPALLLHDRFEAGSLVVARVVQSIDTGDDEPFLMATMIAEGEGARIAVMFGNDDAVALEDLSDEARAFVALIRPAQEG